MIIINVLAILATFIKTPTPVSSLVNFSTLVTASVYLLIYFGNFKDKVIILLVIRGNVEYDLHKIYCCIYVNNNDFIFRIS